MAASTSAGDRVSPPRLMTSLVLSGKCALASQALNLSKALAFQSWCPPRHLEPSLLVEKASVSRVKPAIPVAVIRFTWASSTKGLKRVNGLHMLHCLRGLAQNAAGTLRVSYTHCNQQLLAPVQYANGVCTLLCIKHMVHRNNEKEKPKPSKLYAGLARIQPSRVLPGARSVLPGPGPQSHPDRP